MALADYISSKPVIDTERLRIRPMNKDDVSALKEWLPDPSIYKYWGEGRSKSEKDTERKRFQRSRTSVLYIPN